MMMTSVNQTAAVSKECGTSHRPLNYIFGKTIQFFVILTKRSYSRNPMVEATEAVCTMAI